MTGTGEGRLDTSSPMLTLQSRDGARIVMVLGGSGEHGVSTHPRMAIRRFVVRQVGLTGLAELGLFPHALVAAVCVHWCAAGSRSSCPDRRALARPRC